MVFVTGTGSNMPRTVRSLVVLARAPRSDEGLVEPLVVVQGNRFKEHEPISVSKDMGQMRAQLRPNLTA